MEKDDNIQMNAKRPYKHILKNLLHELASEIIPLSDMMPEGERLAAQEHLKRFEYLIKHDPDDE
jgi:hypothetical protein